MTEPNTEPARSAGDLYDVVDGKARFAWIDGDQIRSVSYHDVTTQRSKRATTCSRR